ncbi:MAG: HAD family hydrolase [Vicinamibacterales bacterium]
MSLVDPSSQHTFAVIFDFDGVILDSETPEFEAHRQIFASHGLDLTSDEWCDCVGLWQSINWFDVLTARGVTTHSRETFLLEKRRIARDVLRMEPLPGIRPLLDDLRARKIPLAVASTSPARWVLPATEALGIRHHFDAIVSGDDVEHRKPAPDVYLLAAARLGVSPRHCVAIEDTQPGLLAAKSAGMRAIVIPHWLTETHDLSEADLRVTSAVELDVARLQDLAGV